MAEPGESFAAAAVRELQEETGLSVAETELRPLGVHAYRRGKDLALFCWPSPALPDPKQLTCTSHFPLGGRMCRNSTASGCFHTTKLCSGRQGHGPAARRNPVDSLCGARIEPPVVLDRGNPQREEAPMPKLRHIAIAAEDPEAMAEFYKKAFDFKEVGRPNGYLADGVFLSDGTLNMAILKFKTDSSARAWISAAFHHFGVLVEDVDAFTKSSRASAPSTTSTRARTGTRPAISRRNSSGRKACCSTSPSMAGAGAEPLPVPTKAAAE